MASVASNPSETKSTMPDYNDKDEEFVVVNPNQYTFVDPVVNNHQQQQQVTTTGILRSLIENKLKHAPIVMFLWQHNPVGRIAENNLKECVFC